MNLDLRNFHKVETSDTHTKLEHTSGHSLTIAHNGLSQEMRKKLEEMPASLAKGGYAKFAQANDPNMKAAKAAKASKSTNTMPGSPTDSSKSFTEPNEMGTAIPKAQLQEAMTNGQQPDVVLMALNKKAPPFGPLSSNPKQHYPPCINPSCKSYGKSHPNCRCYGGNSEHSGVGAEGHFAEGGEVSKEYYCDNNRPHFKKCEYYAEGGSVQKFAKAGEVQSDSDKLEKVAQELNSETQSPSSPQTDPTAQSYGSQVIPPPSPSPVPEVPEQSEAELNPNPEMQSTPAPAADAPSAPAQEADRTPASSPDQGQQAPASPTDQVLQNKDRIMNDIVPETQAFKSDLDNGHIQPETYKDLFDKKGTLGKIGTIFGLMVGGAGSGLAHQPNMLMDMMNKEIDRDLQAQQESSSNKQNFLKINQQARANSANVHLTEAEAALKDQAKSKIQMNWTALHHLVQMNNKLDPNSPQAKQGQQVLAMLNQGVQNENFSIADRAATAGALSGYLSGGQGGGKNTMVMKSGLLGPEAKEVGEDTEQKTIPGVGQATRPVPENDRAQIQAMKVLSDKANDLINYSKGNIATLSPAKRAVAQQKAAEMVNFYNASIQGGVLSQGRLGWLDDQIKKNPTGVVTQLMGNNARLQEIKDSNDHRRNLLLQSYGVPVSNTQSNAPSSSSSNALTSKTGREMYQKNGKWFYK